METARTKSQGDWTDPDRTDKTGKCFIDQKGHFYRQDKDKVLHVHEGIVNLLPDNHIESSRINWSDKFEEVTSKEFNSYFQMQLNKFFE